MAVDRCRISILFSILAINFIQIHCQDSPSAVEFEGDVKKLENLIQKGILTYFQLLIDDNNEQLESLLLLHGSGEDNSNGESYDYYFPNESSGTSASINQDGNTSGLRVRGVILSADDSIKKTRSSRSLNMSQMKPTNYQGIYPDFYRSSQMISPSPRQVSSYQGGTDYSPAGRQGIRYQQNEQFPNSQYQSSINGLQDGRGNSGYGTIVINGGEDEQHEDMPISMKLSNQGPGLKKLPPPKQLMQGERGLPRSQSEWTELPFSDIEGYRMINPGSLQQPMRTNQQSLGQPTSSRMVQNMETPVNRMGQPTLYILNGREKGILPQGTMSQMQTGMSGNRFPNTQSGHIVELPVDRMQPPQDYLWMNQELGRPREMNLPMPPRGGNMQPREGAMQGQIMQMLPNSREYYDYPDEDYIMQGRSKPMQEQMMQEIPGKGRELREFSEGNMQGRPKSMQEQMMQELPGNGRELREFSEGNMQGNPKPMQGQMMQEIPGKGRELREFSEGNMQGRPKSMQEQMMQELPGKGRELREFSEGNMQGRPKPMQEQMMREIPGNGRELREFSEQSMSLPGSSLASINEQQMSGRAQMENNNLELNEASNTNPNSSGKTPSKNRKYKVLVVNSNEMPAHLLQNGGKLSASDLQEMKTLMTPGDKQLASKSMVMSDFKSSSSPLDDQSTVIKQAEASSMPMNQENSQPPPPPPTMSSVRSLQSAPTSGGRYSYPAGSPPFAGELNYMDSSPMTLPMSSRQNLDREEQSGRQGIKVIPIGMN